jgi:hypothetical protein
LTGNGPSRQRNRHSERRTILPPLPLGYMARDLRLGFGLCNGPRGVESAV